MHLVYQLAFWGHPVYPAANDDIIDATCENISADGAVTQNRVFVLSAYANGSGDAQRSCHEPRRSVNGAALIWTIQ